MVFFLSRRLCVCDIIIWDASFFFIVVVYLTLFASRLFAPLPSPHNSNVGRFCTRTKQLSIDADLPPPNHPFSTAPSHPLLNNRSLKEVGSIGAARPFLLQHENG